MCRYLPYRSQDKLKWSIDRESPGTKISQFVGAFSGLVLEMRHQQRLDSKLQHMPLVSKILARDKLWKDLCFYLSVVINLVVLTCYEADELTGNMVCNENILRFPTGIYVPSVLSVLGSIQTALSCCVVGTYYLNFGPLIWKNGIAEFQAKRMARVVRVRSAATGLARKRQLTLRDIVRGATDDVSLDGQLPKWLLFVLSFVFLLRSTDLMYYTAFVAMTIMGTSSLFPVVARARAMDLLRRRRAGVWQGTLSTLFSFLFYLSTSSAGMRKVCSCE